ncbi:MAG: hypothetical protein LBB94_09760 [Clostridiales bacterium]|nr:hypothetical protein [Clostridiales bacterium]
MNATDYKSRIKWITQSALFIALLIVAQALTARFGQVITGSLVNLILIVSTMTCGLPVGIAVALVSPILAKLFGIGPLWTIIPFIMAGNTVLVSLWRYIGAIKGLSQIAAYIAALVTGAVAKFIVLYIGIVRIAVPFMLNLPEKQAATISGMFSLPQLLTAAAGGAVAVIILPLAQRAVRR